MYLMSPYDSALEEILHCGKWKSSQRTGIRTLSVFGMMRSYRLDTEYFPIVTRRKVYPKSVFAELVWFLSGSTNNQTLQQLGCNFWTPWVSEEFEQKYNYVPGAFGPVYGFQLRHFGGNYNQGDESSPKYGEGGFDQLKYVINRAKQDKTCRRLLWSLWNPKDISASRLPPCHVLYQFLIDDNDNLTGILYQRSCDFPIGVPANIQFYSALTIMIAQQLGCKPEKFVHFTADSHIYENQIEAVEKYLELPKIPSPKLEIKPAEDITQYTPEHFILRDYQSGPKLNIPVAV